MSQQSDIGYPYRKSIDLCDIHVGPICDKPAKEPLSWARVINQQMQLPSGRVPFSKQDSDPWIGKGVTTSGNGSVTFVGAFVKGEGLQVPGECEKLTEFEVLLKPLYDELEWKLVANNAAIIYLPTAIFIREKCNAFIGKYRDEGIGTVVSCDCTNNEDSYWEYRSAQGVHHKDGFEVLCYAR